MVLTFAAFVRVMMDVVVEGMRALALSGAITKCEVSGCKEASCGYCAGHIDEVMKQRVQSSAPRAHT